jgi:hypothetical protein
MCRKSQDPFRGSLLRVSARCYCCRRSVARNVLYTECDSRNGPNFGRVFLLLNYTDISQNTYVQNFMVPEIMAIEKCELLWGRRTVSRPWRHTRPLRMPVNGPSLFCGSIYWLYVTHKLL